MAGFSAKVNSATSPRKREWKLPETIKMTNIGQTTQQTVYFSAFDKNLPAAGENSKLFFSGSFIIFYKCFHTTCNITVPHILYAISSVLS